MVTNINIGCCDICTHRGSTVTWWIKLYRSLTLLYIYCILLQSGTASWSLMMKRLFTEPLKPHRRFCFNLKTFYITEIMQNTHLGVYFRSDSGSQRAHISLDIASFVYLNFNTKNTSLLWSITLNFSSSHGRFQFYSSLYSEGFYRALCS